MRYGSNQMRYAAVYILLTFFVLVFLNIYTTETSQQVFYRSKHTAMMDKILLVSAAVGEQEVLNADTARTAIEPLGNLKVARLIVTDDSGRTVYDSLESAASPRLCLYPEVVQALQGNDVIAIDYQDSVMVSRAAAPILNRNSLTGCAYILEYDAEQGQLISSLQANIFSVTVLLILVVAIFTLACAKAFTQRLRQIMESMQIIREGNYTHKVTIGGNDELTALGDEFNDLTERLQTSEQKRRRFVSDASHELKTPLASIKLLTDSILQNDMDGETVREFVGDIGDEAERLNRMTAKLLSLTKVDGNLSEESEIIYMAPTILRAAKRLSVIADQAFIDIHLDLANDSPILILEDDLYQIVYNLIENGIKYNVPDGQLTVTLSRNEENAIIQVSDTGMGIPNDALEHIFERFYRVDKARSRSSGGSGLGLSIVRNIVEKNNGTIVVSSRQGEGTQFTIEFPIFNTEEESL